ncbi:MAG: Maf family protein, partial [Desulfarculaceae bacterium]|nr:Maf family protein [Desulfarculaceae bacterium]
MYCLKPGRSLVLASASPRRQEMLSRMGLEFRLAPAEVDESLLPGETADQAALRLAKAKARAAGSGPDEAVLA